jgi:hypothetical protein
MTINMSRLKSAHLVLAASIFAALVLAAPVLTRLIRSRAYDASGRTGGLDFNQDVQPILASNCFSCHGPDPQARKAGLRLDLEETAFAKRSGHRDAIVPGHPDSSELIARIEATNPHQRMPQAVEGEARPMKPEEIAILREWVKEGARYEPHWAFAPPERAPLPQAQEQGWDQNPIDRFLLARMKAEGLHPSPEADKATLIRRVTLDLTGLLPTLAEVTAFLSDESPHAYEHVVDRLLASPRYGEHRARYWLDYARYADTYGLHYDNSRSIWPYRDYLIRAFNANMPFDQFVKEQIAGDLLPARTLDQLVATGYVRSGVSTNEGGAIPEELRFNIARERAEAYGATFLGLTVGCAVCHDHKFDPTTQKDFYQLTAFFNNVNEQPFNGDRPDWAPNLHFPSDKNLTAFKQALAKRGDLQQQLNDLGSQERTLIPGWLGSRQNPPRPVSTDKLLLRLRLDEGAGDVVLNSAPHAAIARFKTEQAPPQWGETTWLWPDFRMDTSTRLKMGDTGDFDSDHAFSCGGWMMVRLMDALDTPLPKGFVRPKQPPDPKKPKVKAEVKKPAKEKPANPGVLVARSDTTQGNRGWELWFDKGKIGVDLTGSSAKNMIRVSATTPMVTKGFWRHIFFTYDGSSKAAGVRIFLDGKQIATKVESDALAGSMRTSAPLELGWKYPDADALRGTRYQDVRLYGRALSADEAARLPYEDYAAEIVSRPSSQWTLDQWHEVSQFYFSNIDEKAKSLRAQIAAIDEELLKLGDGDDYTLVAEEKPTLAYSNIFERGVYLSRRARVLADTPHFLPALEPGQPHNRLGLAEWTVSTRNPLTARVTVNRMWNEVFGAGLVKTTDDFGIMGGRPSHPELLDWLAVEFRESGWNFKHMYKLMVMSAAYRQSAAVTPELLAKDPNNSLLARGPRFRMDAEMLRDIALESSGLLVDTIGGRSVKPYQPPHVWESVSYPVSDTLNYVQGHGVDLYRRSMYTYWKRMAIQPDMDAFDASPRDTACTRRQRTDTPLQALVTMNDPQWVEAARALAERAIHEGGSQPAQRIGFLSEVLLSHPPPPAMEKVLEQSFEQMRQHYEGNARDASDLVAVGEKPRDASISASELAAWTMVASEMLNLDETLNK